jgi:hypothetical protein
VERHSEIDQSRFECRGKLPAVWVIQFVVLGCSVNGEGEGIWKERLVSHFELVLPYGYLFVLTD